jgi:hypothetical protein
LFKSILLNLSFTGMSVSENKCFIFIIFWNVRQSV